MTATQYANKSRRRSSCTPRQDPDEILKNLKAVKGELLGRSMSICGDKRGMRSNAVTLTVVRKIIKFIIFLTGGSMSIRPRKDSVIEKPELIPKCDDETAGYVND